MVFKNNKICSRFRTIIKRSKILAGASKNNAKKLDWEIQRIKN